MRILSQRVVPPARIGLAIRALPLPLMNMILRRLIVAIRRRHPDLLDRMGPHASAHFLIDPLDLPILFLVRPLNPVPISCLRRPTTCIWDARIAGPIAALLAMINGVLDGDALFFSREIAIEGCTDAVLAMRNAIDAAEIDLVSEMTALWGPLRPLAEEAAQIILPALERLSGLGWTRQRMQTG
jgi:predicted lipid carrier protein YhbT